MMANCILLGLCVSITSLILVSSYEYVSRESHSLRNFNYSNCNSSSVPLYINFLDVTPDPIIFGDNIQVTLNLTLDKDVGRDSNRIEVDLSLRLETNAGSTELCEIIGESYCHFNDFCAYMKDIMKGEKCPVEIRIPFKNNCSCPVEKGTYFIPNTISIPLPKLGFQVRGTFDLTVNLHEEGKILGCFEIHFCITNCKPLSY